MINVYQIKKAVSRGEIEIFVKDNIVYVNDCQSGDCVSVGKVTSNSGQERMSRLALNMIYEPPTEKQISYATDIANELGIKLPTEKSKQAYSQFISNNINAYKRARQSYWHADESDALMYGICLEDIL